MVLAKWNDKYAAAPEGLFGNEPNEYLRQIAARSDFCPATALFLADGDGRNSRWLAARGIVVTGIDLSPVACENGRRLDKAAGVVVDRIATDLETWRPPENPAWEAVFLFYLQAPWPVRRAALAVGWQSLAPGGLLVLEGFAAGGGGDGLGPADVGLRYHPAATLGELANAQIEELLLGEVRLDEGDRHQGLANVIRLVVRKP